MKQDSNKEMDILLRRLARRDVEAAFAESDHLDADELNAYAENALPSSARARYTAHLAECARCRELIVQLSSAAGAVTAVQAVTVAESSAFKKFLASLLSPMVLRYAAPAFGLIVVTAIGVFVLRERNRAANQDVAQRTTAEPAAASQHVSSAAAPESSPNVNYSFEQRGLVEKQEKNDRSQNAAPPPPNTPPSVSSINAEVHPQEKPARSEEADRVSREALAKATPTADDTAKRFQQQVEEEQAKKEEAAKQKAMAEPAPAKAPAADPPVASEAKVDSLQSKSRAPRRRGRGDDNSVEVQSAGVAPGTAAAKDASEDRDRKGETETRTVAGREFRKRNGVWIDTTYDSSRGAITLTRGSEQYRALIADEPQIKTFADQLDGELIVVWKGRAYRIR